MQVFDKKIREIFVSLSIPLFFRGEVGRNLSNACRTILSDKIKESFFYHEYYREQKSVFPKSKGEKSSKKLREVIMMEVLKVSAKSNPNSVAGALAGVLREQGGAEMQAIGAGALNQAVKAVAIARGFVAPSGIDLICIPGFTDIMIDGEERTAIKLIIEPR